MFLKHAPAQTKHETYVNQILQKLIKAPHGVYGYELADLTYKFSAYVSTLRKRGYVISAVRIDGHTYKYYLQAPEIRKSER
jgi:hypothetical protein